MDLSNSILANPLFNLVSVFLGIAGIISGVISAYIFYRSKKPCWAVRNNVLFEGYSSKIGELDIRFNGEQVENLSISRIVFWNQGSETLDRQDIETVNPLRIGTNEEIEILDVSVSLTNSSSSQFETELASDRKSVNLGFDYLDKGQGAIVQVIHTGTRGSDIQIIGAIKGVKKIRKKNITISNALMSLLIPVFFNRKTLPSVRRKILGAAFTVSALFILPVSIIAMYEGPPSPVDLSPRDLSPEEFFSFYVFSFVYSVVLLLLAVYLFRRGLPRGLEAFENESLL